MKDSKKPSEVKFVDSKIVKTDRKPEKKLSETKAENISKNSYVSSITYITLFRYASRNDKLFITLAIICSILSGPLNVLIFSSFMQSMVVYGIQVIFGDPDIDTFLQAAFNFAIYSSCLGAVVVLLSYLATVLMNVAAHNQIHRIRQEYLRAALNQDFAYFDTHQTSYIASKLSDNLLKLEDGIGEKFGNFIYYQACFVSSIVMALTKGWKLALLCLISLPVTLILVGLVEWTSSRLSKAQMVALGKADSIAEEVFSGIRTVYAFCGQNKEHNRYEKHLKDGRILNIKRGFYNGTSMGLLYLCMFCSYALAFWFGYRLMLDEPENYNVEVMIAVFFGTKTAMMNFGISSTLMEVFGIARGAGAQIMNMINNLPSINPLLNIGEVPELIEGSIELKNVVFHYPSRPDVEVLKGVSLSVKQGQWVALVGHSGSGKSTIIQLISRFYDVVHGSVSVDGNNVRDLSVRWLRSQIGLVGQEPVLFNATVRENIRYGRDDATDVEIKQVARQANAHQFIMKLPKGYDTLVGQRGASLSGGQKQRIAIARALIRNPRLLLLDEATSALDTNSEYKVQKALDKAQEGRTTIIVAHRLSTIRNVDVIYVFKSGVVVEIGNHEGLMQSKGHYYEMVMLQSFPGADKSEDNIKNMSLTREISVRSENDEEESFEPNSKGMKESEDEITAVSFCEVIRLNGPEWKSILVASISSLISGFAMPYVGVLLGDFIGALSAPGEEETLAEVKRLAIIFVGAGIITGITNFIQVSLYGVAGEFLTERLRALMFKKLLEQEIAFYDDKSNSTGALCARLSGEAAAVQGATGQRIGTLLQAVGTFTFALILSLIYEWRVGLIVFAFTPILGIILYQEMKMASAHASGSTKMMESSSKIAVEAVANVRTVASLGREELFLNEYAAQLEPALVSAKRVAHIRGFVFGLSRGLFYFVNSAALYFGSTLIVYNNVKYDVILKASQALIMGTSSAAEALAFAPNFQKGMKAAGRIVQLLNKQSKIVDPDKPKMENFVGTGEVSLRSVKFRYPTRPTIPVLNELNLEIEKGKTIALVGASGCGKSTVIQLLERYYDPDEGVVNQDKIPLPKLRLAEVRSTIGFVQQEPILFDCTIGENIAYGDNSRSPTVEEIVMAAKEANIHNFIISLPLGYDTNIGSKGTQLSGGQKQRVAIARALLRRPKLLLLDEATSALNTESEKNRKQKEFDFALVVQEALESPKVGRTCVMIAHRLSTVRAADRICVIRDGRVAEAGTHQHLIELKGPYYKLNKQGYS